MQFELVLVLNRHILDLADTNLGSFRHYNLGFVPFGRGS